MWCTSERAKHSSSLGPLVGSRPCVASCRHSGIVCERGESRSVPTSSVGESRGASATSRSCSRRSAWATRALAPRRRWVWQCSAAHVGSSHGRDLERAQQALSMNSLRLASSLARCSGSDSAPPPLRRLGVLTPPRPQSARTTRCSRRSRSPRWRTQSQQPVRDSVALRAHGAPARMRASRRAAAAACRCTPRAEARVHDVRGGVPSARRRGGRGRRWPGRVGRRDRLLQLRPVVKAVARQVRHAPPCGWPQNMSASCT